MQKASVYIYVCVFVLLIHWLSFAAPLPPPQVVKSNLQMVDDSIAKMFISHAYETTNDKIVTGDNLIQREVLAIRNFIRSSDNPTTKRIILIRYGISDMSVISALIAAKEAGFAEVHVVTDLNGSLNGNFSADEKFNSDFQGAEIKTSNPGQALQALLKAGFRFNGRKYGIYSQPLYNPAKNSMLPIMHEKELYLINGARVISYTSTSNMSQEGRYNRTLKLHDPLAARHGLEHARRLMAAFKEGLPIRKMESVPPLKIEYPDGSFQEIAFTDGKFNTNQRISELLSQPNLKVKQITLSHFVFTNGEILESIRKILKTQSQSKVFGVFDDKFISPHGYGMSAALAGFFVNRPFGPSIYPFAIDTRDQVQLFAYQKKSSDSDDDIEIDPDGPPIGRHLWHDKTTIIETQESDGSWVYVFTGSFNASNHFSNAELQTEYRFKRGSPFSQVFQESVFRSLLQEPDSAIPMVEGVLRNTLARLLNHSVFEISLDSVRKIIQCIELKNYRTLRTELISIAQSASILNLQSNEETLERVDRLISFLEQTPAIVTPQKFNAVVMLLAFPKDSFLTQQETLEHIFWRSDISDQQMKQFTQQARQILQLKDCDESKQDNEYKKCG